MTTYKVVRFYKDDDIPTRTIEKGLTLEEAQEHCRNTETSSSTCQEWTNRQRTKRLGDWFDGYQKEA
jgi:hypothetical protein